MSFRALIIVVGLTLSLIQNAQGEAPTKNVVALLPLDASEQLAMYGQPVAAELSRGLVAAGFEIALVGPGAPVPVRARLVVDGKIAQGSGDSIVLSLRVRDPARGIEVDQLSATAASLTAIDQAATELQVRLVTILEQQLAPPREPIAPAPPRPAPSTLPQVAIVIDGGANTTLVPLTTAIELPARRLVLSLSHVATIGKPNDSGVPELRLTPLSFELAAVRQVPIATGRMRIEIVVDGHSVFNRIARTDTVVGSPGATPEIMAASVARQLVDIALPHVAQALTRGAAK